LEIDGLGKAAILWYFFWFELLNVFKRYILVIGFSIWHSKEVLATVFLSLDVPFLLSPLFALSLISQ